MSSELINPKQVWHRRAGGGSVRVVLVDEQFIGYTDGAGDTHYVPRSRFLALYRREGQQ